MEKSRHKKTLSRSLANVFVALPVVVDVETAGFNAQTDALPEIACIPIV